VLTTTCDLGCFVAGPQCVPYTTFIHKLFLSCLMVCVASLQSTINRFKPSGYCMY